MTPHTDITSGYEAVASVSGHMLEAAQAGDWPRFASLEDDCTRLIQRLRQRTAEVVLDRTEQRVRMRALRIVLANDARIRAITEPGIDSLVRRLQLSPPS